MKKENIILYIMLFIPLLFLGGVAGYFFLFSKPYVPNEYYKTIQYKGIVQKNYTKYESRGNKRMVRVNFFDYFLPYDEADKFIEKGDYIVKNKGKTSLHIYRNHKLINSL
ncbi:hypothetical protein [Empedobacter stercoris]|uniref:hypothetical protein n=1 Tax=Empedobacter stercoris TaxID=1628248 RepID=UPI0039EB0D7B